MVLLEEQPQRRQKADDLLLAAFGRAPDPARRKADQLRLVEQAGRWAPLLKVGVVIELLQRRRLDQVAPPSKDAGSLRTTESLAAREGHQVGAFRDKVPEVAGGRQLGCGVDDHGDGAAMSRVHDPGQRRLGMPLRHIEDCRRALADGGLVFPHLSVAHTGAREAIRDADLDQSGTGLRHRVVVHVALAAGDNHLVRHAGGVRQPVHPGGIEAGEARRCAQHQACGGTGRHVAGLRSRSLGDQFAGPALQLADIDAPLRGFGHGLCDFRVHDSTAEPRRRPRCVDDRTHAEATIDGLIRPALGVRGHE